LTDTFYTHSSSTKQESVEQIGGLHPVFVSLKVVGVNDPQYATKHMDEAQSGNLAIWQLGKERAGSQKHHRARSEQCTTKETQNQSKVGQFAHPCNSTISIALPVVSWPPSGATTLHSTVMVPDLFGMQLGSLLSCTVG